MRKLLVAVAVTVTSLGATAAHAADDPPDEITWTSAVVYADRHHAKALTGADPISATFRLNSNYWRCVGTGSVPICTLVSTLSFFQHVDLQYRHHRVHGKSAITHGGVPWGAWTKKRQRMVCAEGGTGLLCGSWKRVPHPKNVWSKPTYYTAFRLMHGEWFRLQAFACFDDWCGPGFAASVPIYCRPRAKQCYFDV